MLRLSQTLIDRPILSLRTGSEIAITTGPIINPNNLKIEGLYCEDRYDRRVLVLLYNDIRDVIPNGIIINDHEVLSEPTELLRLRDIMRLHFELIGKQVETVSKEKVGKVSDYAVEETTMYIHKLYIAQSLLRSFTGGSLVVDRTQIVEITSKKVIIQDLAEKVRANAPAVA